MKEEIIELHEDVSQSPLYSEDLAPVPANKRTWGMWDLAAIWVGMAVCIPTYLLASYMIKSGVSWLAALIIIGLANLIITVPMVLNGHAGVKYGIPFPVVGRAAFGTNGIHIPAIVRAIVACGWFGIQTWIGGLAFYAIWHAVMGTEPELALTAGKFVGFGLFWLLNVYIIWKGPETIRWMEGFAAPILVLMGIILIAWGAIQGGGMGTVLTQSEQLQHPAATIVQNESQQFQLNLTSLTDKDGKLKATQFRIVDPQSPDAQTRDWQLIPTSPIFLEALQIPVDKSDITSGKAKLSLQFRAESSKGHDVSSILEVGYIGETEKNLADELWGYILWLTAMVGFWATMSISIADITRYTSTQKEQTRGQFIGLPGAMILYSFVGIFVTCAAVINFQDILIQDDAPWDPVTLLSKFDNPLVVVVSQLFMIIATLSTNIAANVIAPANAFSNLFPKRVSFRMGGIITGVIGIIICPWLLLDEISGILLFISGLLGPVLGILIADYFVVRKKALNLAALYDPKGVYSFGGSGFNKVALIALFAGVAVAVIGLWIPVLEFLYNLSWFTGFAVSFGLYVLLMKNN